MFARGLLVGVIVAAGALFGWLYVSGSDLFEIRDVRPNDCKNTSGSKECKVKITVNTRGACPTLPAHVVVDPDVVMLNGKTDTVLVWSFTNVNEWYFCPSRGHGIWFDKPNTPNDKQFRKNFATDRDNGKLPVNEDDECFPYYRWKDKNDSHTRPADKGKYGYTIRFGNQDGTLDCRYDPFIKNG